LKQASHFDKRVHSHDAVLLLHLRRAADVNRAAVDHPIAYQSAVRQQVDEPFEIELSR
jgi:hypothetical protein